MSAFASFRAGRVIHDQLSSSLLMATFRWLDTTPTSRIMTRCTQDVQSIDGPLVQLTSHFFSVLIKALSRMLAVTASAPTYALPSLVIGGIGMLIGHVYIKAQLPVKRNQAIAKVCSPAVICSLSFSLGMNLDFCTCCCQRGLLWSGYNSGLQGAGDVFRTYYGYNQSVHSGFNRVLEPQSLGGDSCTSAQLDIQLWFAVLYGIWPRSSKSVCLHDRFCSQYGRYV
jgi:hypothetical protein